MGDYFTLMVNDKMYEATAVILATGIEYTKPIKGVDYVGGIYEENEWDGRLVRPVKSK